MKVGQLNEKNKVIDSAALAALGNFHLQVQTVMDGVLTGLHPSHHFGASVEFAEHREYAPGDDLRTIDWKAYGKFDRYYVKQFERDTELRIYFLLDSSASMGYGAPLSKFDYARILLGTLATFFSHQGDAPSLLGFAAETNTFVPPRSRSLRLSNILEMLAHASATGTTDLSRVAAQAIERVRERSLIVVLSDLFDSNPSALKDLLTLQSRGSQLTIIHLLHPDEINFPFDVVARFIDPESDNDRIVDAHAIRRRYHARMRRFTTNVADLCRQRGVHYQLTSTDQPLNRTILNYLRGLKRGAQ